MQWKESATKPEKRYIITYQTTAFVICFSSVKKKDKKKSKKLREQCREKH